MQDPWQKWCWVNWKPPLHNSSLREDNKSPAPWLFSLSPWGRRVSHSWNWRVKTLACQIYLCSREGKPKNESLKPRYGLDDKSKWKEDDRLMDRQLWAEKRQHRILRHTQSSHSHPLPRTAGWRQSHTTLFHATYCSPISCPTVFLHHKDPGEVRHRLTKNPWSVLLHKE